MEVRVSEMAAPQEEFPFKESVTWPLVVVEEEEEVDGSVVVPMEFAEREGKTRNEKKRREEKRREEKREKKRKEKKRKEKKRKEKILV